MYYLAINRVQTGPFSEAGVRQRLARGEVPGDTLCWQAGWEKWRKISEVFPSTEPPDLPTTPPPLPQLTTPTPGANYRTAPSSGLATASLICGICMFVLFPLFLPFAIAAIVTGHVAQSKIKRSGGAVGGSGRALAGVIMGYLGMAALPVIGLLAAMAIPAFEKVRQSAQEQTVRNNLRQIWYAAEQQMLETGAESASYDQLVGPGKRLQEESLKPVAGEDYRSLVVRRGDQSISVTLNTGRTVEFYGNSAAGDYVPEEEPSDTSEANEEIEENATAPDEAPESVAPATEPEALAVCAVFA